MNEDRTIDKCYIKCLFSGLVPKSTSAIAFSTRPCTFFSLWQNTRSCRKQNTVIPFPWLPEKPLELFSVVTLITITIASIYFQYFSIHLRSNCILKRQHKISTELNGSHTHAPENRIWPLFSFVSAVS